MIGEFTNTKTKLEKIKVRERKKNYKEAKILSLSLADIVHAINFGRVL